MRKQLLRKVLTVNILWRDHCCTSRTFHSPLLVHTKWVNQIIKCFYSCCSNTHALLLLPQRPFVKHDLSPQRAPKVPKGPQRVPNLSRREPIPHSHTNNTESLPNTLRRLTYVILYKLHLVRCFNQWIICQHLTIPKCYCGPQKKRKYSGAPSKNAISVR